VTDGVLAIASAHPIEPWGDVDRGATRVDDQGTIDANSDALGPGLMMAPKVLAKGRGRIRTIASTSPDLPQLVLIIV
jgi:hypothetical protein